MAEGMSFLLACDVLFISTDDVIFPQRQDRRFSVAGVTETSY